MAEFFRAQQKPLSYDGWRKVTLNENKLTLSSIQEWPLTTKYPSNDKLPLLNNYLGCSVLSCSILISLTMLSDIQCYSNMNSYLNNKKYGNTEMVICCSTRNSSSNDCYTTQHHFLSQLFKMLILFVASSSYKSWSKNVSKILKILKPNNKAVYPFFKPPQTPITGLYFESTHPIFEAKKSSQTIVILFPTNKEWITRHCYF